MVSSHGAMRSPSAHELASGSKEIFSLGDVPFKSSYCVPAVDPTVIHGIILFMSIIKTVVPLLLPLVTDMNVGLIEYLRFLSGDSRTVRFILTSFSLSLTSFPVDLLSWVSSNFHCYGTRGQTPRTTYQVVWTVTFRWGMNMVCCWTSIGWYNKVSDRVHLVKRGIIVDM